MVDRLERRRLLGQPVDQLGGLDLGVGRDVEDRLFRVERGALPADRVERVDHVGLHAQHAALEHGEQADRAGSDDRDVGIVGG